MNVEYIREKGFLGTDYVTMEAIFPTGFDRTDYYTVTTKYAPMDPPALARNRSASNSFAARGGSIKYRGEPSR
jgi:hypothetical protein